MISNIIFRFSGCTCDCSDVSDFNPYDPKNRRGNANGWNGKNHGEIVSCNRYEECCCSCCNCWGGSIYGEIQRYG